MHSAQPPVANPIDTRSAILPSFPTARLIRSNSADINWFSSRISFSVSATFPSTPVRSTGIRTEKSPRLNATKVFSSTLESFDFAWPAGEAGLAGALVRCDPCFVEGAFMRGYSYPAWG